jgi:hypothetical protein
MTDMVLRVEQLKQTKADMVDLIATKIAENEALAVEIMLMNSSVATTSNQLHLLETYEHDMNVVTSTMTANLTAYEDNVAETADLSLELPTGVPGAIIEYAVSDGGNGGTSTASTSTFVKTPLNIIRYDPENLISSLTSSSFTLEAGEYYLEGHVSVHGVDRFVSCLYNDADSEVLLLGAASYSNGLINGGVTSLDGLSHHSRVAGVFILDATTDVSLRRRSERTWGTYGQGYGHGWLGIDSVFSQVRLWKIGGGAAQLVTPA